MDGTSIAAKLQRLFPKASSEDWKKIAAQEANVEDPHQALAWRGKDDLLFSPYYDAASARELQFASLFTTNAQRQWRNVPLVQVDNAVAANALALEHLMNGADGVIFDVRAVSDSALKTLTDNIEWPHCYIGFYSDENLNFPKNLRDIIESKYIPVSVSGALFWETIPKITDLGFYFENCSSFCSLGFTIRETSPADELCDALLIGVNAFDKFSQDANPESVFRSIAFSLSADATLLQTVAKYRAMRILWFQVARAYGLTQYRPDELFIHAHVTSVSDGEFGPHENMIKGTFAAMGALMGGCNALTVESDGKAPFAIRCARNVSSILKEESFFDRAVDPLMGAWTTDALTTAIAEKAWYRFQEKWSADEKG